MGDGLWKMEATTVHRWPIYREDSDSTFISTDQVTMNLQEPIA